MLTWHRVFSISSLLDYAPALTFASVETMFLVSAAIDSSLVVDGSQVLELLQGLIGGIILVKVHLHVIHLDFLDSRLRPAECPINIAFI